MKKHSSILLCALLVSGTLMAQHAPRVQPQKHRIVPGHPLPHAGQQRADAIWSDDFSNASTWTLGTLGNATGNWVIGTTAPSGSFAIPAIESTTASNGFALYDSDLLCLSVDSAYIQNATPIDLSAYSSVTLQFEEYYRNYQGHTYVQVSNDNVNWTTITVNALLASNDDTDNPTTLSVIITPTAGGQSTVWIRFVYSGACDYAWMVDDVAIVPQPDTDMTVTVAKTTMWDYVNTTSYDSLPYTVYPVSELRPLGVNMTITNNGALDATNVVAHITTTDGYDESQNYASVSSNSSVQYVAPAYTPSSSIGDHTITYDVTSDGTDANTADNTQTLTVGVSQSTYARDAGALDGGYNDTDQGDPFILLNVYHVVQDETLYGIDVAFPTTSEVGTDLNAQVTETDENFTPIAETVEHTLVDADLSAAGEANFVSFLFDEPVQLTAGSDVGVGVHHFGGPNVLVGVSGHSPEQTSFLYQESSGTWFYVTNTPMVRMNFSPTAGIAESDMHNGIGLGQNYPNPANTSSTRIDFSLQQSAQVTLQLRDVNGKLVRTLVQGTQAAGTHRVDVSTADLQAGVYFYTLTTDSSVSTKRMTVVR